MWVVLVVRAARDAADGDDGADCTGSGAAGEADGAGRAVVGSHEMLVGLGVELMQTMVWAALILLGLLVAGACRDLYWREGLRSIAHSLASPLARVATRDGGGRIYLAHALKPWVWFGSNMSDAPDRRCIPFFRACVSPYILYICIL